MKRPAELHQADKSLPAFRRRQVKTHGLYELRAVKNILELVDKKLNQDEVRFVDRREVFDDGCVLDSDRIP